MLIQAPELASICADEAEILEIHRSFEILTLAQPAFPDIPCEAYVVVVAREGLVEIFSALHSRKSKFTRIYRLPKSIERSKGYRTSLKAVLDYWTTLGYRFESIGLNYTKAMREVVIKSIPVIVLPKEVLQPAVKAAAGSGLMDSALSKEEARLSQDTQMQGEKSEAGRADSSLPDQEEARLKLEEEARRQVAESARRKAVAEKQRLAAAEEAKRQAAEAAARQQAAEAAAKRQAAEAAARQQAAEAAAKQQAAEAAAKQQAAEAAAKRQAAEAAARQQAAEAAARQQAAEAAAKRQAAEAAARQQAAEAAARQQAAEAAAKQQAAEAAAKRQAAEAAAKQQAAEAAAKQQAAEAAAKQQAAEAAAKPKLKEVKPKPTKVKPKPVVTAAAEPVKPTPATGISALVAVPSVAPVELSEEELAELEERRKAEERVQRLAEQEARRREEDARRTPEEWAKLVAEREAREARSAALVEDAATQLVGRNSSGSAGSGGGKRSAWIPAEVFRLAPELDIIVCDNPADVVELYVSLTVVSMSPEDYPQQSCSAYICTLRKGGGCQIYVTLRLRESRRVLVYVPRQPPRNMDEYRQQVREAVRFLEVVGFLIEPVDLNLPPPKRLAAMQQVPVLRLPPG